MWWPRRAPFEQRRNEVLLAGYKIQRLAVPAGTRPVYPPVRFRAISPAGHWLSFWGNPYLDSERDIILACHRHLRATGNTSALITEMPGMYREVS